MADLMKLFSLPVLIILWYESLKCCLGCAEIISGKQWERWSVIPPQCLFSWWRMPGCERELLSSCVSFCWHSVSHQSVLSHFLNGVKRVGALSLHGQGLFYGEVNSLSEPYGGLWSVRTAPYFIRQWQSLYHFLVKDLHTPAHTEAISLTTISAAVVLELTRQVAESIHSYSFCYLLLAWTADFRTSCGS